MLSVEMLCRTDFGGFAGHKDKFIKLISHMALVLKFSDFFLSFFSFHEKF